MSATNVYRVAPRRRFTMVPNDVYDEPGLSLRARGLLGTLLKRGDLGEPLDSTSVAAAVKEGREAVRTAYNELVEARYVKRWKERNERGHWYTVTEIYDEPQEPDEQPTPPPTLPDMPSPARNTSNTGSTDANPQVTPETGFRASDNRASDNRASGSRSSESWALSLEPDVPTRHDDDEDERATSPAQLVDNLPPVVRTLAALFAEQAARPLVWNLGTVQLRQLAARIVEVGDAQPFIDHALAQDRAHVGTGGEPGATAAAYLRGWLALRPAHPTLQQPTQPRPSLPDWCGTCDPAGQDNPRLRLVFDQRDPSDPGHPCPTCYPSKAAGF